MKFSDKVVDILMDIFTSLERLKVGEWRNIDKRLKEMADNLSDIVTRNESTLTGARSSPARRAAVLSSATKTISDAYTGIANSWQSRIRGIGSFFSERFTSRLNKAAGVPFFKRLTEKQLSDIADNMLIQGATNREWWMRQSANTRMRFLREMRQGIARNETVSELSRRIKGFQYQNYKGGISGASKREAEAFVRTASQAMANEAAMKSYESSKAVKNLQHISTLDLRTTPICIRRDNLIWRKDNKQPIGHGVPFAQPPLHWNCRSTLVPITYTANQLEKMGYKIPDSTRSSMDGQKPSDMTYEDWLKTKSEEDQVKVLGRRRQELWTQGKISLRDLVSQNDRPLTLEEIERSID